MKRIFKYLMMTVIATCTMFYSCETTELEDLASPNALSPDLADADLLLNTIQINYLGAMQGMQGNGAVLGRINYMFGRDYYQNFGGGTVSGAWGALYSGILPDIAAIEGQNGEDNLLAFHLGISKAMAAHIMMGIVDSVGDIPWSEAVNPDYPSPSVDDDAEVYAAALTMLDEAEGYLNSAEAVTNDLFYGGDKDNWIKLVNTLRMRAMLTTGDYAGALAMTGVIDTADADMQFSYGTQELQPDTRHPWYQSDYTSSGANIYQSSWLMDIMIGDADEWNGTAIAYPGAEMEEDGAAQRAISSDDPRRRYYFYRQNMLTPGNASMLFFNASGPYNYPVSFGGNYESTQNGETLSCSLITPQAHLDFTVDGDGTQTATSYSTGAPATAPLRGRWCSNFLGYWGRHHGNDEGTPPDNFTRTAVGVYPSGGSFDNMPDIINIDNHGANLTTGNAAIRGAVGLGNGGGGAGIWPIYLSSYVHFMKAEAAMWLGDTGTARAMMEIGMQHSFDKVLSMGSVDPEADSNYFATSTDVSDFINMKLAEFDAAAGADTSLDQFGWPVAKSQLDILGEQYFVAMYGGANDAWNFIRRTGAPRHLSRGLMDNAESGPFPRTGTYPSGEISANPSILQRQDNNTTVFWDQGAVNPAN
jgi:hypothetical protein